MKIRLIGLLGGMALFFHVLAPAWAATDWYKVLEQQPKNQTALSALGKQLKVPAHLVHTKILAEKLTASYKQTFNNPTSFYTLVGCHEALGNFPMARALLTQAIQYNPRSAKPVLAMAYDYYLEGNFAQALNWYDKAIALDSQSFDGYHGKMLTLMTQKKTNEAMVYGRQILGRDPRNYFAGIRMGNMLYDQGNYTEALKYYTLLPTNIDFKLGMGLCLYHLKQYSRAAPLLKEAVLTYPANPQLLAALRGLNALELKALADELSRVNSRSSTAWAILKRMTDLFELNGDYQHAAQTLQRWVPQPYQFKDMIRIAANYGLAGKFTDAANWYLLAAAQSPDRRTTSLAAADSYLLAGEPQKALDILNRLQREKAGKDLLPLLGRAYSQLKQFGPAKQCFNQLGQLAEKAVEGSFDPRPTLIYAIDCYLDAANYERAGALLNHLAPWAPGADLDQRSARMFFERKEWSKAIAIYRQYPNDLAMQNSKGWAYIALGEIYPAEKIFKKVLAIDPKNAGARKGLHFTKNNRPWEIFAAYTTMDYGGYQDDRLLVTESLRYAYKKGVTTFSHTRTDVPDLSPGGIDFKEDLIGAKLYYGLTPRTAAQIHVMRFNNNDASSDDSTIAGGSFMYFPNSRWLAGLEYSGSKYTGYRGSQISPFGGYKFNKNLRADVKGIFSHTAGGQMRASQSKSAGGASLFFSYLHGDKLNLSFGGFMGERRLHVNPDAMFAYNILDKYKTGWAVKALYKLDYRWKLFASYGMNHFISEWQAAANEKAGNTALSPEHSTKTLTLGSFYQF
jgi:tetratricopeptide (TPR) repeat protein